MHSVAVASVVLACVVGGSLLGLLLGARLPRHHLDKPTQNLVKLGMSTIATLMALVLGLMVATAKASFDTTESETKEYVARLMHLDRVLARYGPETTTARHLIRWYLAAQATELWPEDARRWGLAVPTASASALFEQAGDELLAMSPHDEVHKALHARALQLAGDLGQARWLFAAQTAGSSIPTAFLVILVFWASTLFTSFGLFAPRHATAVGVLLVAALSIAAAVFVILEMDRPFSGVIRISNAPVRHALATMGAP
jgi:hypothetical protein